LGLVLDEPNENEILTQVNGLDVLISDDIKGYTNGSLVDYESSPYGEGFTIGTSYACC
jgi:Fe-S cluster assembly iron-binding protein IscA